MKSVVKIVKLLDEIHRLSDSSENIRRRSLWQETESAVRGDTQWHGIPKSSTLHGGKMPITAECLNTIWREFLGFMFDRYYTEPEYFLENYLQIKIRKFNEFPDDTPIDRTIPLHYGIAFEAGLLGQEVCFGSDEEPWLGTISTISESTELDGTKIDLKNNELLKHAIHFYGEVKRIVGPEFNVQFPQWFRGPQGVALYLRGFENFLTDIHLQPEFCRKTLRYVTDAQKKFLIWRSEFLENPIQKCDLFNDDVPIMSPETYDEFVVPLENELCDFCGGVYYWHSCGDITRHISKIENVKGIELLDLGVSMEDKGTGINAMKKNMAVEVRVRAQQHVQEAEDTDVAEYMGDIAVSLMKKGVERYVIRSSGMSILLGTDEDLRKLRKWVEITREVFSN
jgi:uroporphyrinogen-III decarboxylase